MSFERVNLLCRYEKSGEDCTFVFVFAFCEQKPIRLQVVMFRTGASVKAERDMGRGHLVFCHLSLVTFYHDAIDVLKDVGETTAFFLIRRLLCEKAEVDL